MRGLRHVDAGLVLAHQAIDTGSRRARRIVRLADRPYISGLRVVRARVEAAAYGAALFGGYAAGYWPSATAAPRPDLEAIAA